MEGNLADISNKMDGIAEISGNTYDLANKSKDILENQRTFKNKISIILSRLSAILGKL